LDPSPGGKIGGKAYLGYGTGVSDFDLAGSGINFKHLDDSLPLAFGKYHFRAAPSWERWCLQQRQLVSRKVNDTPEMNLRPRFFCSQHQAANQAKNAGPQESSFHDCNGFGFPCDNADVRLAQGKASPGRLTTSLQSVVSAFKALFLLLIKTGFANSGLSENRTMLIYSPQPKWTSVSPELPT
jgi:hypothetical protein